MPECNAIRCRSLGISHCAAMLGAHCNRRRLPEREPTISTPCWELFEAQTDDDRTATLGNGTMRIAVEVAMAPP